MKKLIVLSILLLVGCKGPMGSKGDQGLQGKMGPTGPTQIVLLSSSVTSDDFFVTDPQLLQASGVLVYNSDGITVTPLPYFLPSTGINTYYLWTPGSSQVEVFNAHTAGATQVIFTIILG